MLVKGGRGANYENKKIGMDRVDFWTGTKPKGAGCLSLAWNTSQLPCTDWEVDLGGFRLMSVFGQRETGRQIGGYVGRWAGGGGRGGVQSKLSGHRHRMKERPRRVGKYGER